MHRSLLFPLVASLALVLGACNTGDLMSKDYRSDAELGTRSVQCWSDHDRRRECFVGRVRKAVMVRHLSGRCIEGKSWGYNPVKRVIWVDQGCAGVFEDAEGVNTPFGGRSDWTPTVEH